MCVCVCVYVYMPMIAYVCVYTYEFARVYSHTSMHTQICRDIDRQIDVYLLHFFGNDFLNNDVFFNEFDNRLFDDSIHVHDLVFRHNFFDVNRHLCKCARRCEFACVRVDWGLAWDCKCYSRCLQFRTVLAS